MANRYWVGGTGNWDGSTTTNWSATSGGAGGASVPTSSDNVFFDSNSGAGTCTYNSGNVAANLDFTGYTGQFAGTAGSSVLTLYGTVLTFSSTMTIGSSGPTIQWISGATGNQTVTTNGLNLGPIGLESTAPYTLTLADAISCAAINVANGASFDSGGHNMTLLNGFTGSATSNSQSISFGASTIDILCSGTANSFGLYYTGSATLTFNAGTSSINISDNAFGFPFDGGGHTFNNVTLNCESSTYDITGSNIFANLTVNGGANGIAVSGDQTVTGTLTLAGTNSTTDRLLFGAGILSGTTNIVRGTQSTITCNGTVTASNVDIQDIVGAGTASWNLSAISGKSGDGGNNSGITFTTPATQYWVGNTDNFSDVNAWANASGGVAGSGRVPLPQDSAVFDANSFSGGSQTATVDIPRVGSVDFTAATHSPALALNSNILYGSLTLISGMSLSGTASLGGAGSNTLTSAGKSFGVILVNTSGSWLAGDNITSTGQFNLLSGTFNCNGKTLSAATLASTNSNPRTLSLGAGGLKLTGTGTVWNTGTRTNLTVNGSTSTVELSNTSSSTKTFAGGGVTLNNLQVDGAASNGIITFSGSNTFNNFDVSANASLKFTASTTQTAQAINWTGTSGHLITLQSTSAAHAWTISVPGGGTVSCDYLSLKDSAATGGATFHAGANSTNVSGNSGWLFP